MKLASVLLQTTSVLPDYDYIEDGDGPKSSTITSGQAYYSVPMMDIYNIPEGDTLKFINLSTDGKAVDRSRAKTQIPTPYEIPNEAIYEDPGVQKEKIYEWFDKKKFRKLQSTDIK